MKNRESSSKMNGFAPSSRLCLFWLLSLALALFGLPAVSNAQLQGFWTFEEGTGTTTADQSGNGDNGTFVGSPVWTNSPFGSHCLSFDQPSAAHVDLGQPANLMALTNAITVCAWVYPRSFANGRIFDQQGGGGSRGMSFETESGVNGFGFQIAQNGNTLISVDTPGNTIPLNQWIHICGVFIPGVELDFYTNGLLSATTPTTVGTNYIPNLHFAIGDRPGGGTAYNGLIDDMRVYNVALSQAQIQALPELVQTPLSFTIQPASKLVLPNSSITFTSAVSGAYPLYIQWYSNNAAIPGANNLTFNIPQVLDSMSGYSFSVSVSNLAYSVTSTNAILTVSSDTNPPTVVSVQALGNPNQVIVKFSKPLSISSAQNPPNYAITNVAGGTNLAVYSATLGADYETVTLLTDPMFEGSYTMVLNNIQDQALIPNTIKANTTVAFTFSTLVGFWQFEEGTGTTTADSGPGGFTGTLENGPTWVASPFGHYCLDYSGASQYVDVGNPSALQILGPMTLSAWVWPTSTAIGNSGRIVSKGDGGGDRGWFLDVESTGEWGLGIAPDLNTSFNLDAGTVPVNVWTHVAGVYDPYNTNGPTMDIYTNGELCATLTANVPYGQVDSGLDVAIGSRPGGSNPFAGMIDDVRIYAKALSQAQIQALPELVQSPLGFTLQPASVSVLPDTSYTFSCAVTGAPPWFIQWYQNGAAISGANTLTYTISPVLDSMNDYYYSVTVSNLAYSITSSNAILRVSSDTNPPTVVSVQAFGNPNQVVVLFDKPLAVSTAQNPPNYVITNTAAGTNVAVYSATLGADNETVTLLTDTMTEGTTYDLVLNGIQDLALIPNTIRANTTVPFTYTTLVGYWRFEEGHGTTTADSGPGHFTGTFEDGTPAWVASPFGRFCLQFDGLGDNVDVGNPLALQILGPITLSAWVAPDGLAVSTAGRIVAKQGGGGSRGYSLNIENDGSWDFEVAASPSTSVGCDVPNVVPLGQWVHVAGVFDPNNTNGPTMFVYTNGVLDGTLTDGVPYAQTDSGLDVAIGSRPGGSNPWSGKIDEVRIYARALAANEIAALAAPIFLSPTLVNNEVILNWVGPGQLQSAPAVTGVYTNIIPAPTSPYTNAVVPGQNQFFRLVVTP